MESVGGVLLPKTVLDIGGYDGCASREYVNDGDRWVIVDNQQYLKYDRWEAPETPDGAEYLVMDCMDYHEPAEIVVCSNVLYHVPNPWVLIKHLKKLTKEKLYLTTYFDKVGNVWNYYWKEKPLHPHKGTAATIYYRPTIPALIDELKKVGFVNIKKTISDTVTLECSY